MPENERQSLIDTIRQLGSSSVPSRLHKNTSSEHQPLVDTIKQLGGSCILLRIISSGRYETIYVSPAYWAMMENADEDSSTFDVMHDIKC